VKGEGAFGRARAVAIAVILSVPIVLAGPGRSPAAEGDRGDGPTPPRLSLLEGDVSFWRPGAEDWAPAKLNMPLAPGDELYGGDDASFEMQLAPRAFVRGDSRTLLGLESLEETFVQLKVTSGRAVIDVREGDLRRTIELDTPHGAFSIDRPGYDRLDVDQERTTFVTRHGARASVIPVSGEEADVTPDTKTVLRGNEDNAEVTTASAPDPDDWDRWNEQRTGSLGQPLSAQSYLSCVIRVQ